MKTFLKSTTTLGLCLTLALPAGAFAQSAAPRCGSVKEQAVYPCYLKDGTEVTDKKALRAIRTARGEARQDAAAEGEQVTQEALDAAAQKALDDTEAVLEEARKAAKAEAQAQARAEREAQAAEAARAAKDAAAAEARAAAKARADAEARAATEARTAAEAQAAADARAAAEAQTREERRAARREERRRERAAAAAAAAEAAAGNSTAAVVTEQVGAGEVRTSNEEFETSVTGAGQAAPSSDGGGLSKFEKVLLLGLGAVVVGSVLANGDKVVSRSGDRVVVQDPGGDLRVLKDDDALIRRPGDEVSTQTFDDGSTRTVVNKPDGSKIVTIRGRDGSVLRRVSVDRQGREYVLFDDLVEEQEVVVKDLPKRVSTAAQAGSKDEGALRAALAAELRGDQARRFSLRQIREIREVRALAPELELDAVRFASGSAAIAPEQARSLARIGTTLSDLVMQDPRTVFLVEGHTDAVGDAGYNLALSDRRAETVALALTEYFDVPPENMITQGYGESALKVPTETAEPANRRAVVRNITALLQ